MLRAPHGPIAGLPACNGQSSRHSLARAAAQPAALAAAQQLLPGRVHRRRHIVHSSSSNVQVRLNGCAWPLIIALHVALPAI